MLAVTIVSASRYKILEKEVRFHSSSFSHCDVQSDERGDKHECEERRDVRGCWLRW